MPFAHPATLAEWLSDGRYRAAPHHILLGDLISRAVFDGNVRAIVAMPPRHGKSYMVSYWGMVWALEQEPRLRTGVLAYEADFAMSWGRRVRNTIQDCADVLDVRVASDSGAANRWNTTEGEGGMVTAGVGGPITGRGLDLCVIDDPVKNAEQARSEVYRAHCWDWWTDTVQTRLEPGASVIVTMTRWHEDDLAGRLILDGGWEVISLPAIAEEGDALGRAPGEALWPEQYPADCEKFREAQRYPRTWAALYQQRPSPAEGSVFKSSHFRTFRVEGEAYILEMPDGATRIQPADSCYIIQTCDTAMTSKKESDWTVVETWAVTPKNEMLLLDVARARLEVPDQWPFLVNERRRYQGPTFRWQGVETKGSGIGLFQTAQRAGMPLHELKAETDKVTRAMPLAIAYENGLVYHNRHLAKVHTETGTRLGEYEDELLAFPNAAHDDQVDAAAYAAREIQTPAAEVIWV